MATQIKHMCLFDLKGTHQVLTTEEKRVWSSRFAVQRIWLLRSLRSAISNHSGFKYRRVLAFLESRAFEILCAQLGQFFGFEVAAYVKYRSRHLTGRGVERPLPCRPATFIGASHRKVTFLVTRGKWCTLVHYYKPWHGYFVHNRREIVECRPIQRD